MNGYHLIIHEATGITDTDALNRVEDMMRHTIFHSTLDWQTRDQLHEGAREAVEIIRIMNATTLEE